MPTEVLLAAGYAIALIAAAGVLEWLSRHANNRSRAFRTGGFEYDRHHDYWVCQQGEQLWPAEFDREKRLIRYRAKSSACRTCAIKHLCTDSEEGREVTRPIDPWPHSEAGRFHRGIAVMIAALAAFVLLVEIVRNHAVAGLAVLVPVLAATLYATWWLARDLIHTPDGFPEAMPAHGNRLRPGTGEEGKMSDRGDLRFADEGRAEAPGVPRYGRERKIRWRSGQAVNGSKADAPDDFTDPESTDGPHGRGATITAE